MFLLDYKNGVYSFAAAADLNSLKEAEVDPAINLSTVIESGLPLYLPVPGRFPKYLLRLILKYYSVTGDVSPIYLFAKCSRTGNWAFAKPCTGPTLAVVGGMMQSVRHKSEIVDSFVASIRDNHPATCAAGYIQLNGGNATAVWNVVSQIGDIRGAMARAANAGYSAEAIANNLHTLSRPKPLSKVVSVGMHDAVKAYERALDGEQDFMPFTFEDQLLLATFGYPLSARLPGSLSSDIMNRNVKRDYGMAMAAVATLQLIVTAWAAAEFHADMFDEAVFYVCEYSRAKAHADKYKKVCNG